jgi:hypothetical protein
MRLRIAKREQERDGLLECFRAKWMPVRVKKTRQNKKPEAWF